MADVTDVKRLEQVLELVRRHGLRCSALVVGDIRIALVPEATAEAKPGALQSAEQRRMESLREKSRKTFGRVLPDEALKEMEGAL